MADGKRYVVPPTPKMGVMFSLGIIRHNPGYRATLAL